MPFSMRRLYSRHAISSAVLALQRRAAVVLQKPIREGFGLTVAEAMWKGAGVIGGQTGGIRRQIEDGVGGFLVDSMEEAAARIVQLLKDPQLRGILGARARERASAISDHPADGRVARPDWFLRSELSIARKYRNMTTA